MGWFMGFKISGFNAGRAELFVVGEAIVTGHEGFQGLVVIADDLLVGGEEQDLVGSVREVALDQVLAVGRVEASEWCVDDGRDRPAGGASEAPEKGGGEELAFAGREPVEGQRPA